MGESPNQWKERKLRKCKKHSRYNCWSYSCSEDTGERGGFGEPVISTDGNLDIGIGGGLTIDPSDGSLGMKIGGIGVDFG